MKETGTINGLRVAEVEEVNPLKVRGEFDWYGARVCMGDKCTKVDSDAGLNTHAIVATALLFL